MKLTLLPDSSAMAAESDFHRHLEWVRHAHDEVLAVLDRMPDDGFSGASRLPGWTRAHVAAHLAHNAEGFGRLATWAATGVETPMYASVGAREADIEATTRKRPADLRAAVARASNRLVEQLEVLPTAALDVEVHGLFPPAFPAALLPWQRVRECWVHVVDLDAGVGFEHLPADVAAALLDEAAARSVARGVDPPLLLVDTGSDRRWALGAGDGTANNTVVLTGDRAALVGWLTGRGPTDALECTGTLPPPPPPPPPWP